MKKIFSVILVGILCLVILNLPITANAEKAPDSVNSSYSYWLGYNNKKLVYTKDMYEVDFVLSGKDLGYSDFKEPSDLFFDKSGKLYIIENGNSRLTILDKNYKVTNTITEIVGKNENLDFQGAKGVATDSKGNIYIADTFNARILKTNASGKLISEFLLPESPLIPDDFIYQPVKIAVDKKDYMYVISSGSTYGALLFDPSGEFQGFYGANTVKNDIGSLFNNIWKNFFATDEQLVGQVQKIPFQFTDICLDQNDFAYTVTGATDTTETEQSGQIRCLNPKGKNLLKIKESNKFSNSDSFNFGDNDVAQESTGTAYRLQNFVSVEVDNNGYIYALDATYGRIYIYDAQCNLLSAFGGGMGAGIQKGTFINAATVAAFNDRLVVSDYNKHTLTCYKLNTYGKLLMEADELYLAGNYSEGKDLWLKINSYDPNCQPAYWGLAKACLIEKDYEKALFYAKEGYDYLTYNQAFSYTRNEKMKSAFVVFFVFLIIIIAFVFALKIFKKKKNIKFAINENIRLYFTSFTHPFLFANSVKDNNAGSLAVASISLILYFFAKTESIIHGGFLFSKFDKTTYNSVYTLLGTVGIALLWIISYWGVSVLFSGKCKLKQIYIITGYSVLPLIIGELLCLIASNILVLEESIALTVINGISIILCGIVLIIGCMTSSEYGFFKFTGVAIISITAIAIIVFVIFMVLTLDQQLITFFESIYKEIKYR